MKSLSFSTNIFLIAGSSNQAIAAVLPAITIEKSNAKKNFLRYRLTYSLYNLFRISLLVIFFNKI